MRVAPLRARAFRQRVGLLLLAVAASACTGPVGVRSWNLHEAYREAYANALSEGTLSVFSAQVLLRLRLLQEFEEEPGAALAHLHAGLAPRGDADRLFALAELSFLHADTLSASSWSRSSRGTRPEGPSGTSAAGGGQL